jgi:FtsP/CotA-like multicopper oxidase with cupredoxin domain
MRPGEFQIWEIGNLGADSYFDLELDGHSFWVLGRDGNPTELPVKEQTLYLSPGARAEVLVQSAKAGHYPLRSLKVDTGPQGDPNPQVELGTVIVEGGPVNGGSTSADLSKPAVALDSGDITAREVRKLPITNRRTITFSETADGKTFFLNNKMFDQGRIDTTVTIGDVEEWTLRNVTGERHVFHIHQTDFLVTEQEGAALDYKGLRDVIDIPQQRNGKPGEVKIIVPFLRPNIAGKFVYHCHILEHEDNGMMANIVVLPAK